MPSRPSSVSRPKPSSLSVNGTRPAQDSASASFDGRAECGLRRQSHLAWTPRGVNRTSAAGRARSSTCGHSARCKARCNRELPAQIQTPLAMVCLTALRKPDGCIRDRQRLSPPRFPKQWATVFDEARRPCQFALQAQVGTDALHWQLTCGSLSPNATIGSWSRWKVAAPTTPCRGPRADILSKLRDPPRLAARPHTAGRTTPESVLPANDSITCQSFHTVHLRKENPAIERP